MTGIQTLEAFLAHALALEREAAERYAELADQMRAHNNAPVAELFEKLAGYEAEHAATLAERAKAMQLPPIAPWEYRWEGIESPESVAYDEAHYRMTPYHALQLALRNEERAKAFFEGIAAATEHPEIRAMAQEMAAEEAEHVGFVQGALAHEPAPTEAWDEDLNPPNDPD